MLNGRLNGQEVTLESIYSELYGAPRQLADEVYDGYLNKIQLQQCSAEESAELGAPVVLEEIGKVIGDLANGKTPGGDGLPAEFFKQYKVALTPRLVKM